MWSIGQSSWLQIQRSGFDSRHYQIFGEVVCLERGPFSLVSTTEELLGRKSSGFGLESREYGRRDVTLTMWHPPSAELGTNIADKRRSFARGLRSRSLVFSAGDICVEISVILLMLHGNNFLKIISVDTRNFCHKEFVSSQLTKMDLPLGYSLQHFQLTAC
jgi:hypothetical protein